MKTSLRRLFNYWLPPGINDISPVLNPLVDLAVKINASCLAMLSGGEIDWDEIKRDSEEWAKLVEMARQPPLVPYVLAHGHYRGSEMERVNTAWAKKTARVIRREALLELTRLSEEMGGYDDLRFDNQRTPKSTSCEDHYVSFHAPDETTYSTFNEQLKQCEANISRVLLAQAKTETEPKSTSPSADQTQEPSTETKC